MSKFLFRAIRPDSSVQTGEIEAADLESANRKLTEAGLQVKLLKPAFEKSLDLDPPPAPLPPLDDAVQPGPGSKTKGFRSRWKENQKFNASGSALILPPAPPLPPLEAEVAPSSQQAEAPPEPGLPSLEDGSDGSATAEQAKFRSRWRDNLKFNQESKPVLTPPPLNVAPRTSVPALPHASEEASLDVALSGPPTGSPGSPAAAPKPFRAKWKANLERTPGPPVTDTRTFNESIVVPTPPEIEVLAGPTILRIPPGSKATLEPSALPLDPIPKTDLEPKKSFSSRWKDNLRHNKAALDLAAAATAASESLIPAAGLRALELNTPVVPPSAEATAAVSGSLPVGSSPAFLELERTPKIQAPNTELEGKDTALDISSAAARLPLPEASVRRGSQRVPSSRPLSKGRPHSLELPPPSADPNEQTPMGASFVGSAEELSLGAPSLDATDELFSSDTPSAPVTSIKFAIATPPVTEAPARNVEVRARMADPGKVETPERPLEPISWPPSRAPEMEEALKSLSSKGPSDANKTQMMDISDIPLGSGPKSKSGFAQANKTQMMDISELPLGPGPKSKSGFADANKTQMMDLSELSLGPGPKKSKSKSGSASLDSRQSTLDLAIEGGDAPALSSTSRARQRERADEPQMKKILIRCFLFCVFLELMFLLLSRRTLSVEGSYKFAASQSDPISISFVLDNETTIDAPEKALQTTQTGPTTKYSVDVPYYKFLASKEIKVRIEVKASIPYFVDSIPLKFESGHMILPMMSLENRGRAASVGKNGL